MDGVDKVDNGCPDFGIGRVGDDDVNKRLEIFKFRCTSPDVPPYDE